jgi:hypothetical protein
VSWDVSDGDVRGRCREGFRKEERRLRLAELLFSLTGSEKWTDIEKRCLRLIGMEGMRGGSKELKGKGS